jgi:UDP-GlcNAc3NAcA epimerase
LKIVTIVGARPQFIKLALVSRLLRARGATEFIVHTGQHYDQNMSQVFFDELDITAPDVHLAVGSGRHGEQTGRMLERIEAVLLAQRPDWVLIYGDTNSTLAGALAAAKCHLPVAHVEAGLRSWNKRMPEEINRIVADHVSELLFAPTHAAVANLRREGIDESSIKLVGDVMYDVVLAFKARAAERATIVDRLSLNAGQYVLATVHRAENTDEPSRLATVFGGLAEVAQSIPVVLPLHPRTRTALDRAKLLAEVERTLVLIEPVGYLDMIALAGQARLIATDSGGLQKEAFFLRVPCVTLRDETEWVELVEVGWNRLINLTSAAAVGGELREAISAPMPAEPVVALYGDGRASQYMVDALLSRR